MNTVVNFVRSGMNVRRYHQRYTAETDTVGKHSCGVALFCQIIDPACSKQMLLAALTHDLAEYVVGDVPAPTKRLSGVIKDELDCMEDSLLSDAGFGFHLDESQLLLLKLADCLDGIWFCIEERERGNRAISKVGDEYARYLHDLLMKIELPVCPWAEAGHRITREAITHWRTY